MLFWPVVLLAGGAQNSPRVRVLMPEAQAKIVSAHVSEMYRYGYFAAIQDDDFFHGHMIFSRVPGDEILSLENIFETLSGVLYHTAEYNRRWQNQAPMDPSLRNPRSIFGDAKGENVYPAIDMISVSLLKPGRKRAYERSGTVYANDITSQNQELSQGWWESMTNFPSQRVSVPQRNGTLKIVFLTSDVFIYQKPEGRFEIEGGPRYEIYMAVSRTEQTSHTVGAKPIFRSLDRL